ncbi:sterol delta7 reductase [Aureococcus anophagefferens]|uniref:7-dehydrocholesterol reductase n=1 Tax=Aureococcus anophagefferens TaxID=44056 RepID=A0ABR1FNS5_AURAN
MVETRSARKAARPNGRDAEVANPPKPAAKKKAPRKASKADELPAEISPYDMTAAQLALHCYFLPMCLLLPCPVLCAVLAFATNSDAATASLIGVGTTEAWTFLAVFNTLALLIYWWPGETKCGPLTATGHLPSTPTTESRTAPLFSGLYAGGAYLGWYDFGVLFDVFGPTVGALNAFGLVFCASSTLKDCTPVHEDSGTSGGGFVFDYYWGMELYPRICGVDVKKFVNCRFSMTFWQLSAPRATRIVLYYPRKLDPGLFLAAVSQYVYLVKFFVWEIGYMRSIDIIVDRAGFYETWGASPGCPPPHTLHSRICVTSPSQLSWPAALAIFGVGIAGVGLNYWADNQRMTFREKKGDCLAWGGSPRATSSTRSSSRPRGPGGSSRTRAVNGPLPLFYAVFLTILLIHRAIRDEEKCLKKYGQYYEQYMDIVKYKIIPASTRGRARRPRWRSQV